MLKVLSDMVEVWAGLGGGEDARGCGGPDPAIYSTIIPTIPACTQCNHPEEDISSGKINSFIHPSMLHGVELSGNNRYQPTANNFILTVRCSFQRVSALG